MLVNRYGSGYDPPIWITEAGARLDQPNIQEPDGSEPQCDNGELDAYNLDWSGGFKVGACLDWAPDPHLARLRQAWAAQAFHDLATPSGPRVTQVDWWTPNNARRRPAGTRRCSTSPGCPARATACSRTARPPPQPRSTRAAPGVRWATRG